MKKFLSLALALTLAAALLAGCAKQNGGAGSSASTDKTPEELTQLYADAITENGGEMVEYNPVISEVTEDDLTLMILESMGLKEEDMIALGISASMVNISAYGIAAVMPAEGKAETVKEGLQSFIDKQKQNFEQYLVDQYEIACNAKLETLEDGTVLMVMSEDQNTVFDAISKAIQGA